MSMAIAKKIHKIEIARRRNEIAQITRKIDIGNHDEVY